MDTSIELIRALIERTDPDIPPAPLTSMRDWNTGSRKIIANTLAFAARDATTVMQALAICEAFLRQAKLPDLTVAQPDQLTDFVLAGNELAAQHLRRNSLLSCQRALATAGRMDATTPLDGLRLEPITTQIHRKSQSKKVDPGCPIAQQEVGTSDEVLLLRSSARYARSRQTHRPAAAVAIATSGASPSEGPGVRWLDRCVLPGTTVPGLRLPGNHHHDPAHGCYLAPRIVPLDRWERQAVSDWATEVGAPADSRNSMIYSSTRPLASVAAVKSVSQAIDTVRSAASLDHVPGTTTGGLSYWGAAHTLVWQGHDQAAAIHGTDLLNLLRKLTHVTDRRYRR